MSVSRIWLIAQNDQLYVTYFELKDADDTKSGKYYQPHVMRIEINGTCSGLNGCECCNLVDYASDYVEPSSMFQAVRIHDHTMYKMQVNIIAFVL